MAHTRFKSVSFTPSRDTLIHPNAHNLISLAQQNVSYSHAQTSFWDARDSNPLLKQKYAEKVYKTVIDPQTGQPKAIYAQAFKALLINPEQVRDMKLEDFQKNNTSASIAQVRHSFHRLNRTN